MSDPRTIIEIIDQSEITPLNAVAEDNSPIFYTAFTSAKGPETLQLVKQDLIKTYGNIDFSKYGQPFMQAFIAQQNGARLLVQRIVADDAILANAIVVAKILKVKDEEATNAAQALDPFAPEVFVTTVKYEIATAATAKTEQEVYITAQAMYNEDTMTYPLFSIVDNGRGASAKRFKITSDYTSSKGADFNIYQFQVLENTAVIDTIKLGLNPDLIWYGVNYSLENQVNKYSTQVKSEIHYTPFMAFVDKLAEITGLTNAEVLSLDLLSVTNKEAAPIPGISINPESVNVTSPMGVPLQSGSNGKFGVRPMEYKETVLINGEETVITIDDYMQRAFDGSLTYDIYDQVQYQFACVIDANYGPKTKAAIERLAEIREDFFFFRDGGLGLNTFDLVKLAKMQAKESMFVSFNHMSYEVIDPFTQKRIPVTSGYTLARLLPIYFSTLSNNPLAGMNNSFVMSEALKGTLNFKPVYIPGVINQREELGDFRVNYGSYYGNDLVLETQYTTQKKLSQFSYINNVLQVQQIIRDLRLYCPRIRYNFTDGKDLSRYKSDIQNRLDKFKGNFKSLEFEYIEDETMIQNKIFYAAIRVSFRDYVESEYFKIYAINTLEN